MRFYSFNTFLKQKFKERVRKISLDAGLSCPNRDGTKGKGGCIYCDARGSGNAAGRRYHDLKSQALAAMDLLSKRYKAEKFIVYFQSFCNTYAPPETLQAMYDEVTGLPGVVGLSVATRPDCLTKDVLDLLASYSDRLMVWLELGLQTSNDETLKRINRGHTYKDFLDGYRLVGNFPLLVCLHVIIGLPGEDRRIVLQTARDVSGLKPDGIKIHSLFIHRGTALERFFNEKKFRPPAQNEFVSMACDFLELLSENTVIQRLTGDPDPRELVAPQWALNKHKTLNMIAKELEQRNSRQGKKYEFNIK